MYASGLRVSEVISVKIGEIDLKQKTIKVTGKGNKQRILPIYQDAAKFISSYIKSVRKIYQILKLYSSNLFVRKNSKKNNTTVCLEKIKRKNYYGWNK